MNSPFLTASETPRILRKLAQLEQRADMLEVELRKSEERVCELSGSVWRLSAAFAQLPCGVAIADATSGALLCVNDACRAMLGLSKHDPAQALDLTPARALRDDGSTLAPHEWPLLRTLRTGESVSAEGVRLVHADGTEHRVRMRSSAVRDERGELIGVATFEELLRDKAREAEGSPRDRLAHLLAQAPALIEILRGPEHVYEFSNLAAAQLFGGESVGKSIREVLPEIDESRVALLDCVLQTGERCTGVEVPTIHDWDRNGRPYERFFNFVYEPYRDARGEVEGVMSFGFDVTDLVFGRQKLEAVVSELEAANRTKDEFLATVSHELRTPLNAILGWVQMLRSDTLPESKRARAIETIERNAQAQAQLIEDLLDVSRIISGKMRLDVSTIDVAEVMENAVDAVRPAIAAKGLTLHQTIDPNAAPILGDADRLRQVVWNLLTNAVKFTPRGGKVQMVLRRHASSTELLVADDGQGIAPAFLPHVFERFRQADGSTTRKHGGLGLGLAIVRHLVELHGGTVRVDSEGLGKGALFSVSLPISPLRSTEIEQKHALRAPLLPTFAVHQQLYGVHVLVVDDEPDARDLLAEILVSCSARVSVAGTVAEALSIVETERPDVIVSDIGMPGEDGYALIRKLRALPPERGGKTPAVALTAYVRVEDRTKALVAGFNMHLSKPVEPSELLAVLTSLEALYPEKS